MILITRYVSLGSLLGSAALFPAMLVIWAVASGAVPPAYLVYAVIGPALIWVAHADNIDRLIHGTERKFDLGMLSGRSGGGEAGAARGGSAWRGVNRHTTPDGDSRSGIRYPTTPPPASRCVSGDAAGRASSGARTAFVAQGRERKAPRGPERAPRTP